MATAASWLLRRIHHRSSLHNVVNSVRVVIVVAGVSGVVTLFSQLAVLARILFVFSALAFFCYSHFLASVGQCGGRVGQ